MEFLVAFLWYTLAFILGALVAVLIARTVVPACSEDEAFADLPGARRLGDVR